MNFVNKGGVKRLSLLFHEQVSGERK